MSHEEKTLQYQEVLSAYRNGDADRYPDIFEEALAALETDAELAVWFEADQAFDDAFRTALNNVEVPEQKPVKEVPIKTKRIHFIQLAAAALVVIALSMFGLIKHDATQDAKAANRVHDFRKHVAAFAAQGPPQLDLMDNDLAKLRDLNVSNGGVYGPAMDEVFANGLPMGCKVLNWEGVNISLYCFGNSEGQVVHCFVVPLETLNGPRAAEHLKAIVNLSERDTGGFVAGDSAYLLVSSMPGVDIKPFLLPAQENHFASVQSATTPIAMSLAKTQ